MTIELLNQVTRSQIQNLHPLTKRELIKYFRNQLTIIIGNADLITGGKLSEAEVISAALAIAKTGRQWQAELQGLFAEREQ